MNQKLLALAALTLLFLWSACSKSTPFGASLLGDQLADYTFTDTLTVRCTVEREDSVLTSDRTFTAAYFLCGELNDATFGKSSAEVYSLLQMADLSPAFGAKNKSKLYFDSVVMFIRYAPAGVWACVVSP